MMVRNVGFLQAAKLGFQKYFQFSGRSQRAEFWWFQLFMTLVSLALTVFDYVIFGFDLDNPEPFSSIWLLVTLIPALSIGWRRMHDIGKSGWWSLLVLAPVLWTVVASVIMFTSNDDLTFVGVIVVGLGVIATIASAIYVIVLCATDSQVSDNRYGPSVKYHNADDVI